MKHYKRSDLVSMRFYSFYISVRLPLLIGLCISIIMLYAVIIVYEINNVSMSLIVFEPLTAICACIGLSKEHYWGYLINKIFVIAGAVIGFAVFGIGIYMYIYRVSIFFISCAEAFTAGIIIIIINILIYIYFEKRRYLFRGVPKRHGDADFAAYTAEICWICILHLNGTTSKRIGTTDKFNFNYSEFIDRSRSIYFREEVRNGQIVNVVTTKEKWLEAVTQNSGSKRDNTTYE